MEILTLVISKKSEDFRRYLEISKITRDSMRFLEISEISRDFMRFLENSEISRDFRFQREISRFQVKFQARFLAHCEPLSSQPFSGEHSMKQKRKPFSFVCCFHSNDIIMS